MHSGAHYHEFGCAPSAECDGDSELVAHAALGSPTSRCGGTARGGLRAHHCGVLYSPPPWLAYVTSWDVGTLCLVVVFAVF